MKKFIIIILSIMALSACASKSPCACNWEPIQPQHQV